MLSFNIIVFMFAFGCAVNANAGRIAERTIDQSKVDQIYVAPGLATSIEFPENVKEVITGAPQIFKSSISTANPNEVILQLANVKPFKTNLIVRTVRRTLVFDLIPNLQKHQDLIIVKDSFGKLKDQNAMTLHEKRIRWERGEDVPLPTEDDL